jgi:hypothetical protein
MSKLEAIREASLTRLRPVLMTSSATIVGYFPLILVSGAGAAARNSIGLFLVGGMTVGSIFTLFVIPSLYMLMAKDHQGKRVPTEMPSDRTCLAPAFEGLRIPNECRLVADARCQWSISCDEKLTQVDQR